MPTICLPAPCRSLAQVLECIKACAGGRPIELLRKESVASLPAGAAFRILGHSYAVVLPVTSLPFPPLPLSLQRPGAGGAQPYHTTDHRHDQSDSLLEVDQAERRRLS